MNPEWNTPPNGDFASYVERLTAQAARRALRPEHQHTMEEGGDAAATSAHSPEPYAVPSRAPAAPMLPSPGQQLAGSDNLLARGLLAALGNLRERIERSIPVPPKKN